MPTTSHHSVRARVVVRRKMDSSIIILSSSEDEIEACKQDKFPEENISLCDAVEPYIKILPTMGSEAISSEQFEVDIKRTTENVLRDFLTACLPYMKDKNDHHILERLKTTCHSANPSYLHSEAFCNLVTRLTSQLSEENVFVSIKDLYDEVHAYRVKMPQNHYNNSSYLHLDMVTEGAVGHTLNAVHSGSSENCNQVLQENFMKHLHVKRADETASDSSDTRQSTTQSFDSNDVDQHVEKLENILNKLDRKIKHLQKKELNLKRMDDSCSAYILEDKLKHHFMKVWNRICKLKGRSPFTGREIERKFHYEGTRYPELNKKVEKFINKKKIFPDYHDMIKLVQNFNEENYIKLSSKQIRSLAQEIFTDVGNELQRRRNQDGRELFGCYMTDDVDLNKDPAEGDEELHCKLEESRQRSRKEMDELLNSFTEKQYELKLEPEEVPEETADSSPPRQESLAGEEEEDEDEDDDADRDIDIDHIEAEMKSDNEENENVPYEENTGTESLEGSDQKSPSVPECPDESSTSSNSRISAQDHKHLLEVVRLDLEGSCNTVPSATKCWYTENSSSDGNDVNRPKKRKLKVCL